MNYKDVLYSSYYSNFNRHFFGETDLLKIKAQFPVWGKYFLSHLPKDRKINILDIGCGNGGFLYFLKSSGYSNVMGVDVSEDQINKAKEFGVNNVIKSDLLKYLVECAPTYDVIFAIDLIEHFDKKEVLNILIAVRKALKDNGMFIIQTTNAENPFFGRIRYGDFTHDLAFTKSSLTQILYASGFTDCSFHPTGPVIHNIKSFVRYLIWNGIVLMLNLLVENGIFTQNIIAVARK
jgi:2-polyprenyl-3-methyl-5-hydroxy-6-metoxy-1,4-benzoquinol methylase